MEERLAVALVADFGSIAYGFSELAEEVHNYKLGSQRDFEPASYNVLRDEFFLGNQACYDTFGRTAVFISVVIPTVSNLYEWGGSRSVSGEMSGCEGDIVLEGGTGTLAQYGDDFGKMGTYVENPEIKVDWTQYAEHGAERMQQRGMTQEMVNSIVENGMVLSQNNGNKFVYITKDGVAIVSKEGKLITTWSSVDFDSSMLEIIEKLFGK